jgi:hypothetical protein
MPEVLIGGFGNGNSFLDLSKNNHASKDPDRINKQKFKSKG